MSPACPAPASRPSAASCRPAATTPAASLVADGPTIERRIAARTSNGFGQAPEELAALRRWQDGYEAAYRGYGAVIIDAARPLGDVVDEILRC